MSYQVTARKWRPQKFEEVVGQEHITETLKNSLRKNRIAHAYIFTGPRGVGKTTTARILAKALNCLNPVDFEPCNQCEMCKAINEMQSMDIIEIDAATNRGIDEVRTLRESVKYAPTLGKYKVYIIDEVHMLTTESFNAFLKTLEEPPSHTIFVFATTDIHKVPPTIISRCQRFDFRRLQIETIKQQLKKIAIEEKIKIDDKALTIIAKKADGAMRDAQSYFDQVVAFCGEEVESETVSKILNLIDEETYFSISDAITSKNFQIVFDTINIIYQNGWDFTDFLDGLIEHFRNILTVVLTNKTNQIECAEIYKSKYLQASKEFSKGDLLRILHFLSRSQQELRFSNNQKLKLEIILSHLIGLEKSATISEIISAIETGKPLESTEEPIKKKFIDKVSEPKSGLVNKKTSIAEKKLPDISESELKNTQLKSSVSYSSNQSYIDDIISKWKIFVEDISKEKALLLAPIFSKVSPSDLDGNKLYLENLEPGFVETLSLNQEYLEKKSLSIFGKKLQFLEKKVENNAESSISTSKISKSSISDPFEKIIIEELGGREIS
ncbi:MAG: DNA polymerase III subunit gamma/tau [Ignavibacterium album]|uniref:DNA polymerase III subunit gamma/tau n=1 Tax=Ignavibacterium album TaxID=591197 RepID=UPI0026EC7D5B|nr:DNA polymerase III subunit gamma/tau [Ignavibacterium album]MCX8106089.1 DNA polymerase III subunit gamma/tau [Ignavibacterium album]